jgi:RNA polymerase-binding transcription factor DksA
MCVTTGDRVHYREILRRARAQSMLTIAATNAVIDRREKRHATKALGEAAMIEREIDQLIADQESATLVAINGALQVLHDNPQLYGVCEKCGEPISPARLNSAPWRSRCDEHPEEPVQ